MATLSLTSEFLSTADVQNVGYGGAPLRRVKEALEGCSPAYKALGSKMYLITGTGAAIELPNPTGALTVVPLVIPFASTTAWSVGVVTADVVPVTIANGELAVVILCDTTGMDADLTYFVMPE